MPDIVLRADIDTVRGIEVGVPNLIDLYNKYDIPASFFPLMGPDETGKTSRYLKKLLMYQEASHYSHISPWRKYGLKNMLYGLLLPSPAVGSGHADILVELKEKGHEVGVHGWDHVRWGLMLDEMHPEEIELALKRAITSYMRIFREKPKTFIAPCFRTNKYVISLLRKYGFLCSGEVGYSTKKAPMYFNPATYFGFPQIPVTLGFEDHCYAKGMNDMETFLFIKKTMKKCPSDGYVHLYMHPVFEGIQKLQLLEKIIQTAVKMGFEFKRMIDIYREHF